MLYRERCLPKFVAHSRRMASYYLPQEEGEAAKLSARYYTLEELMALPPRDDLVPGRIERATVGMYFGETTAMKTVLAVHQSGSLATGTPWLGFPVPQGPVMFVAAEGDPIKMGRRIQVWLAAHQQTLPPRSLILRNEPVPLDSSAALDRLARDSEILFRRPPLLFIFDTLAASLGDADENCPTDAARIVRNCKTLVRQTGATVMLVHHPKRGEHRPRGASNWTNDLDWCYEVRRKGQEMRLEVHTQKVKERAFPPVLTIGASVVALPHDPSVDSIKLELSAEREAGEKPRPAATAGPKLTDKERAVFEKVAPHLSEGIRLAELLKRSGVGREEWNRLKDAGLKAKLYEQPARGLYALGETGRRLLAG